MLESRPMKQPWLFISLLSSAVLAAAQAVAPSAVEITAEPSHHLALANQRVRVFQVELAPHQAMLMHHHRRDYVFVSLGPSEIENHVAGKPPVNRRFQEGETLFVPGGFAHSVKNLSGQPFRIIAVELLGDDKARPAPPPKWEEDRGLRILNRGTQDLLFLKDGVRATDLQLNPGGVLPRHHHSGPHLVVAVSDLNLRSQVEGKGATNLQLKAGNIAWVQGGFTHTLTNLGPQKAKLITLEFP